MSLADLAAHPLAVSCLPWLIRRIWFKHEITVLVYHDPTPDCFERHLRWLLRHYRIISMDEAIEALATGQVDRLGEYPLVITIDDGRRGNYRLLPVIQKYGVRPCLYLCSAVVGTHRNFWDNFQISKAPKELMTVKKMTKAERRKYLIEKYDFRYEDEFEKRSALSVQEIRDMAPFVDFGSHGRFHQPFAYLTDTELREEAAKSKSEIEAMAGKPCRHFSYPMGMYDGRCEDILREAGYASVRTTDPGRNRNNDDCYGLRVTGASDDALIHKLSVQSCGLYRFIRVQVKRS